MKYLSINSLTSLYTNFERNNEKSTDFHLTKKNSNNKMNLSKNKIFRILIKKTNEIVILFLFVFIVLIGIILVVLLYSDSPKYSIDYLNLFIIAHKDFNNKLINPYYKIICDNKSQLKNNYQIPIIETFENNELYPKKRGYCEGSKIYYIWKKYKSKEMSTKYVGFVHYRRFFIFKNKLPNLDKIFNKYGAITNKKLKTKKNMKSLYSEEHFGKFFDEIEEIIKENFTQLYSSAKISLNRNILNCCNIFIMKNEDFIKYGEFIFGVLFEFDRRYNIKTDIDIKNLIESEIKKAGNKYELDYQCRQEGFLMERLSSIFYDYYFEKRYEIRVSNK